MTKEEKTLSDALVTYKIGTIVQDYDLKHHIKLAQDDLKKEFAGTLADIEINRRGRIISRIDKVFIKHFGAKLLEAGE